MCIYETTELNEPTKEESSSKQPKVKITIELTRVAKKSLSLLINFEDMLVFAELIRESFPSLST
jgi:hypothetical protein